MKSFIIKTSIFLLLLTGVYSVLTYFWGGLREDTNTYLMGMVLKHKRIDSIKRPKLIIAGGSNIAFGINSERIEKALDIPTVNLGLHAGLGPSFILKEAEKSVSSGDVLFLSLEYFFDNGNRKYALQNLAVKFYPPAAEYITENTYFNSIMSWDITKSNIQNDIRCFLNPGFRKSLVDSVYSKNSFNEYGDVVSHLNKKGVANISVKDPLRYKYWDTIEEINALYDAIKAKGVEAYYFFPAYAKSEYERNTDVIKQLRDDIYRDLKMPIACEPVDFVYSDSLFFDTIYHIGKEGREKRTTKMIELVKRNKAIMEALNKSRN